MRHTRLAAVLGMLLAFPCFAFGLTSPSTWFGGDKATVMGRSHDPAHEVTSNGVTKVQMQYLYKEDWLVTDVDMSKVQGAITNLVAGNSIVIEEIGDGTRKISAITGVDTSTVERIVSDYDRTNITVRINAKQDRLTAGYGISIFTLGGTSYIATTGESVDWVGVTNAASAVVLRDVPDWARESVPTVTNGFVRTADLPTKVSDLTNDAGYVTGSVTNGLAPVEAIPTKVSQLTNDAGYVYSVQAGDGISVIPVTGGFKISSLSISTGAVHDVELLLQSYDATNLTHRIDAKLDITNAVTFLDVTNAVDAATNGLVTASVTNGLAAVDYVASATNAVWVSITNSIADGLSVRRDKDDLVVYEALNQVWTWSPAVEAPTGWIYKVNRTVHKPEFSGTEWTFPSIGGFSADPVTIPASATVLTPVYRRGSQAFTVTVTRDSATETNLVPTARLATSEDVDVLHAYQTNLWNWVYESAANTEAAIENHALAITNAIYPSIRKLAPLLTNTYTKAETEQKIIELSPAPGNYAAVSNAAMNARSMTDLDYTSSYDTWTWETLGGYEPSSAVRAKLDATHPRWNDEEEKWEADEFETSDQRWVPNFWIEQDKDADEVLVNYDVYLEDDPTPQEVDVTYFRTRHSVVDRLALVSDLNANSLSLMLDAAHTNQTSCTSVGSKVMSLTSVGSKLMSLLDESSGFDSRVESVVNRVLSKITIKNVGGEYRLVVTED